MLISVPLDIWKWKWKSLFVTPMDYSPWNSPGQNTGVGSRSFLQGIFPTQGLNPGLPHCRWILYQLSHRGSPEIDHMAVLFLAFWETSMLFPILAVPVYNPTNSTFSSVQSLSSVQLFATPWIAAHQASLSITTSWSSLRLTSIESVMPSSHLILCRPLYLLPPIPLSIRVLSSESTLHIRWPKYWSFSFSITPSKEIPGLISFRMDWLDLLTVQVTQESSPTPQFKSINPSALSFLHSPTLTSIHDYWKNHSLD